MLAKDGAAICGNETHCTHAGKDKPLAKNRVNQADDEGKNSGRNEVPVHSHGVNGPYGNV